MKPTVFSLPYAPVSHFLPAGCIHWPLGDKDLLRRWVREVATLPNAFAVLMGDTSDNARTHFRDHVRSYRADQNSQQALDEYVRDDIRKLAKELDPIRSKLAGAICGNHFWEFADGTNSEQCLCQLLRIPYLGPVGIVCVEFRDRGGKGRVCHQMTIYCHHHGGSMGGRTTGGDVAALERSEMSFDADVYALSHTHRRFGFKLPKLTVTAKGERRIIEQTRVLLRTGAFLKGYREDNPNATQQHIPTYAEQRALRPTDLGWITLRINLGGTHARSHDDASRERQRREFTVMY